MRHPHGLRSAANLPTNIYNVNIATSYLMVPFNNNSLLFVDSNTGAVNASMPISGGGKIYRFGSNFLRFGNSNSSYSLTSALSGLTLASDTILGGYIQDSLKFGADKILTMGWTTSGSTTATAYTFTVNNSGLSQIASATSNNLGNYNSTYGMIQNPEIAGQAYISSSTGILTSMGTIGTKAPLDNDPSAPSARGYMSVNSAGTSISFGSITSTAGNFSRPMAATGSNGYCLISGIDGSDICIFSGSSHTQTNLSASPPVADFSPAAILGETASWLSIRNPNIVCRITSAQVQDLYTLPNNNGATVQSIPGGAAVVYTDGSQIKYRKYLSGVGLQSAVTVTNVPAPVTSNSVNPGYIYSKFINY